MTSRLRLAAATVFVLLLWQLDVSIRAQIPSDPEWGPRLQIRIIDEETGKSTPAHFSLEIDSRRHEPRWVGAHGLRFVSVHISKRQSQVVTYARGTGPVEASLPPGAQRVRLHVTKGFDYIPQSVEVAVKGDPVSVEVRLRRWNRLREEGWSAADAHLHYDRIEPASDRDWFAMMAGDGLSVAQFMVLKGGMVPGVWARQYAYGREGTHSDGKRLIVPGEEYRDQLQGHRLIFGLSEVIQPIMAGRPDSPYNYPPLHDVLREARRLGGFAGVAHGGRYGEGGTPLLDAVLGAVDFWEIGNAHLYELDGWYRLMNCGFHIPPSAGTDLPNNPYRDPWQPFLGSIRMYVRTGGAADSDVWNEAVRRHRVFVSSGPVVRLKINGEEPGGTVSLPAEGGSVVIDAELAGTQPLEKLELVRNGKVIATSEGTASEGGIHKIRLRKQLDVSDSAWFAARGPGIPITPVRQDAVAHTAAVRVLVGDEPIWSETDAEVLRERLSNKKEFYETNGRFAKPEHCREMLALHDKAITKLARREP